MTDDKKKRPNLLKDNVGTRFKKGNTLVKDGISKPHSIRKQINWVMAQEIDIKDLNTSIEQLLVDRPKNPKAKKQMCSVPRFLAVRMVERVMKKMEPAAIQILIEQVDGKLVQPIDHQPDKISQEDFITDEEAAAAWADDIKL